MLTHFRRSLFLFSLAAGAGSLRSVSSTFRLDATCSTTTTPQTSDAPSEMC